MSFNQPKLFDCAWWNPKSIIVDSNVFIRSPASGLFVDRNNTIYAIDEKNSRIHVWFANRMKRIKNAFNMYKPISIFVVEDGSIYVSSDRPPTLVKWRLDAIEGITVENVNFGCYGLFIHISNYMYCSITLNHMVARKSLDSTYSLMYSVAGKQNVYGPDATTLYKPHGIFVAIDFDLYVADCENDRIQWFENDQDRAITVAGKSTIMATIILLRPVSVLLDADRYLFIVDKSNHRIIGSNFDGFYCIAGCSDNSAAPQSSILDPRAAAFDSYGNLFVVGGVRGLIQKFILMENSSCTCSDIKSKYSSVIDATSQTFVDDICKESERSYEAIQMKANVSGQYSFSIECKKIIFKNIYKHQFDLNNPEQNLYLKNISYKFDINLEMNIIYILVISTHHSNGKVIFSVIASGLGEIKFNRTNNATIVQTIYSSRINGNSPRYLNNFFSESLNYYQAFTMKIISTDKYIITGQSESFRTRIYLYNQTFISTRPLVNSISYDWQYCFDKHSKIDMIFQSNINYVFVVTTSSTDTIGNYSIFISGPMNVLLNRIRKYNDKYHSYFLLC